MMDVLEKLERMAALPQGAEMPEWLSEEKISWDVPLRKLFFDAAEEIKRLRMAQTPGPSFREIKQEIKHGL